MNIIRAHNLACPVDGAGLETGDKQLVCENGHVFDIARQGYVNLLPVQHKRSKQPGDSSAMVAARKRFLNSGVYQPVARRLAEIAHLQTEKLAEICVLDAGCGEGYYLDYLLRAFEGLNIDKAFSFIGLDISKPAIIEAARRSRQISWIVGTNRQVPVDDASIDLILCVFGFQNFDDFNRILKPGGKIILLEAGPGHLLELRRIIYTEVKTSTSGDFSLPENTGLALTNTDSLQFSTGEINNQQINDLLLMTPHFFRASKQGRDTAMHLQHIDLSVDIIFRILEKTGKNIEY